MPSNSPKYRAVVKIEPTDPVLGHSGAAIVALTKLSEAWDWQMSCLDPDHRTPYVVSFTRDASLVFLFGHAGLITDYLEEAGYKIAKITFEPAT